MAGMENFNSKSRGINPMTDEQYIAHAKQKMAKTSTLMSAEAPKSQAWWKLRKLYVAQEVRLRNRVASRKRKLVFEQTDAIMQAIIDEVYRTVPTQTFKIIAQDVRKALPDIRLTYYGH